MKLLPLKIANKFNKPFSNAEVEGEPMDMQADAVFATSLTKVKETAEKNLGKDVNHALAAVPAYINEAQMQPKKDPNTNSGMIFLHIISKPWAAIADDKTAEEIREVITNKFPDVSFKPDCKKYVERARALDAEAAKRPQTMLFAIGEISEKSPNVKLNPVCKTDIESACDAAVAKCLRELKTLASPTSIEKLIYEAALHNQIDDKAVEEIRQVSGAK
ncbi:unnamed protein product, partial [Prorocentrum cordatum]